MDESLRTDDGIQRLVEKYSDMLFRIAYLHMKNKHDAEDAVQSVLICYLEKRPVFESDNHEKAWFIRVCINLCKNSLKTCWFRKRVELPENLYGFTPDEHDVMDAVMQLPLKYRSVVLLFYFEDYSIAEIAAILKRKETTVGSQLHRARLILKSMLKEDFENE